VISAGAFIRDLRKRVPDVAIVFSTVTPTGQEAARRRLAEVDLFIYFPFDLNWVTRSVVGKVAPELFIFLETEIWPNFLRALAEKKVPAVLVNGRISEGGFRRYRRVRFFLRYVLEEIALFLMQTERDAERILALGAPPGRVERTGNMKYDQAAAPEAPGGAPSRKDLGLQDGDILVIAGSVHPGEERAILEAYETLKAAGVGRPIRLLIAPRHLDRLSDWERLIAEGGLDSIRRKGIAGRASSERTVILLDTLGELDQFYSLADLIFVGGSLVPVGGHNVLEAAARRKPVFFGPFMDNFQEIADQLKGSGGGIEVADGKDLGAKMVGLLRRPEEFEKRGESAYRVVLNNRGAVIRNLERVMRYGASGSSNAKMDLEKRERGH
jgi:3-deoxy-D-manno-octulosonic-acid transferase